MSLSASLVFTILTGVAPISSASSSALPGPHDPVRVIIESPDHGSPSGVQNASFRGEIHVASTPEQVINLSRAIEQFQLEIQNDPRAFVSFGIAESPESIRALRALGELPEFQSGVRKLSAGWERAKSKLSDLKIRFAGAKLFQLGAVLTAKQAADARSQLGETGPYEKLSLSEIKERFGNLRTAPEDLPEDQTKGLYVLDRTGGLIQVQKPGVLATFSFFKLVMGPTSVYFTLLAKGEDPVLILPLALLSAGWQAFVNSEYGRVFMQKVSADGAFADWARQELQRLNSPLPSTEGETLTGLERAWALVKALTPFEIRYALSWSYLQFLDRVAEKGHLDRAVKFFLINGVYNFVDAGLRHLLIGYPFPNDDMTSLQQAIYTVQRVLTQSAADSSGSVVWATSFNRIIEAAQDELKDAQAKQDPAQIEKARKNLENVWSQQRIFRNNLGSVGSFLSTLGRNNMIGSNVTILAFNAVGTLYGHAVNKVIKSNAPDRFRTFFGYMRALSPFSRENTCSAIARPKNALDNLFEGLP